MQEKVMRLKFTIRAAVVAAALAGLGLPQPAQATDAREAIRLCDKNPKCSYNVRDNGSVDITVDGNNISCPQEGPCTCDICNHPAGIKSTPKKGVNIPGPSVMGVLKR
jgi:hypothetical protein